MSNPQKNKKINTLGLASLLLICLVATQAQAGWTDKQGQALPDTDYRKSDNGFGAQLIFTDNPQQLSERWVTQSQTIDINTTEKVEINQPISAFILFSGCKTDKQGNCSVSMRFRVIQPDGKVYAETPIMEVWHNKPVPVDPYLELSVQYLKLVIEPNEQQGRYMVQVQVRDDNTAIVLFLQRPFTVADPKKT